MSRWHQHDDYLRKIDRRNASEHTPLRLVPVLAVAGLALLVWARIRKRARKAVFAGEPLFVGGSGDAPRKDAA